MGNRQRDLGVVEHFAEGRHHARERPRRAALVCHGKPVGIGLAGRKGAVGEIRQRLVEADLRYGGSAAVVPVAGRAAGAVQLGGGIR